MRDKLLLGVGRTTLPLPAWLWRRLLRANARQVPMRLQFMSEEHHRVRDFVVTELPRAGAPMTADAIAAALGLELPRVREVLAELEQHLTFLFRSRGDAVTWAYPVTVDATRHRAHFSTGEDAYSP